VFHISIWGVSKLCMGGLSPPKSFRGDGTTWNSLQHHAKVLNIKANVLAPSTRVPFTVIVYFFLCFIRANVLASFKRILFYNRYISIFEFFHKSVIYFLLTCMLNQFRRHGGFVPQKSTESHTLTYKTLTSVAYGGHCYWVCAVCDVIL